MIKYSFIVLLLLLIYGDSPAQTADETPFSLNISLAKKAKSKRELFVTVEITNISDKKAVIDKNSLGYGVSFSAENGTFLSQGEMGKGYEGRYLILAPNESYEEIKTIELKDDFFRTDEKYTLKLIYGQFLERNYEGLEVWRGFIESNDINFYLKK